MIRKTKVWKNLKQFINILPCNKKFTILKVCRECYNIHYTYLLTNRQLSHVEDLLFLLTECKFLEYNNVFYHKKQNMPMNLKVKHLKQLSENKFLLDWFIDDINKFIELNK